MKRFKEAQVNGGSNYDFLRKMVRTSTVPPECTWEYIEAARNKFIENITKYHKVEGNLECWIPDTESMLRGHGLFKNGLQYKVGFKTNGEVRYWKPVRTIMWFLSDQKMLRHMQKENTDVSHLCHNRKCVNPQHLCAEHHNINLSRNLCPGPADCLHSPKCLKAGSSAEENVVFVLNGRYDAEMVHLPNNRER